MVRDDSSVITIGTTASSASNSKQLSQAKLDQLARARAKSLEVRRRQMKAKLEGKLNQLRSMLGSDLRHDTVERVAKEMINQEERHAQEVVRLREKHTSAMQELADSLTGCKDELRSLRKSLPSNVTHTTLKEMTRKPASEASSL
eukprot:7382076-Prymnesium_polylepis.1